MLLRIENKIPVRIPILPRICKRAPRMRPEFAQERVISRELPVAVKAHDTPHLPVGRGMIFPLRFAKYPAGTKRHPPVLVCLEQELHAAHGLLQLRE
ncbi:hypothetical protein SDC9_209462 [bioreactor metagenome]|uniref:Uncharacterized protein n=1 Tax=bioreactor metagenome TaxID=1076179 RepID=A0A645JF56_9ZZZZ